MRKISLTLAAACLTTLGLASLPATAQQTPAPKTDATAPRAMQHKMGMRHRMAHPASCYDYAWESQEQKDCLAKGGPPPSTMKKHMTKKKTT